ncbi:MAG: c-type cytochrome [Methylococcaceae bacterium]|nr:c-type cytochrome [Methylococcaceae bacterium]
MGRPRLGARKNARHGRWQAWFLVLAFVASTQTVAAEEGADLNSQRIGRGNPGIGKQQSDAGRCQECHGSDGMSNDERIPNHAGQYAGYLIKQLDNFQAGERKHPTMTIMAEDLTEADKADIAAYFASQKVMEGEPGSDTSAKNLFLNGDTARDLPACVSCHGENGKGRVADNVTYPVLGGQRRVYLRSQLVSWKLGERANSPGGVMNKVAKALTDDEMTALANYLAGL